MPWPCMAAVCAACLCTKLWWEAHSNDELPELTRARGVALFRVQLCERC